MSEGDVHTNPISSSLLPPQMTTPDSSCSKNVEITENSDGHQSLDATEIIDRKCYASSRRKSYIPTCLPDNELNLSEKMEVLDTPTEEMSNVKDRHDPQVQQISTQKQIQDQQQIQQIENIQQIQQINNQKQIQDQQQIRQMQNTQQIQQIHSQKQIQDQQQIQQIQNMPQIQQIHDRQQIQQIQGQLQIQQIQDQLQIQQIQDQQQIHQIQDQQPHVITGGNYSSQGNIVLQQNLLKGLEDVAVQQSAQQKTADINQLNVEVASSNQEYGDQPEINLSKLQLHISGFKTTQENGQQQMEVIQNEGSQTKSTFHPQIGTRNGTQQMKVIQNEGRSQTESTFHPQVGTCNGQQQMEVIQNKGESQTKSHFHPQVGTRNVKLPKDNPDNHDSGITSQNQKGLSLFKNEETRPENGNRNINLRLERDHLQRDQQTETNFDDMESKLLDLHPDMQAIQQNYEQLGQSSTIRNSHHNLNQQTESEIEPQKPHGKRPKLVEIQNNGSGRNIGPRIRSYQQHVQQIHNRKQIQDKKQIQQIQNMKQFQPIHNMQQIQPIHNQKHIQDQQQIQQLHNMPQIQQIHNIQQIQQINNQKQIQDQQQIQHTQNKHQIQQIHNQKPIQDQQQIQQIHNQKPIQDQQQIQQIQNIPQIQQIQDQQQIRQIQDQQQMKQIQDQQQMKLIQDQQQMKQIQDQQQIKQIQNIQQIQWKQIQDQQQIQHNMQQIQQIQDQQQIKQIQDQQQFQQINNQRQIQDQQQIKQIQDKQQFQQINNQRQIQDQQQIQHILNKQQCQWIGYQKQIQDQQQFQQIQNMQQIQQKQDQQQIEQIQDQQQIQQVPDQQQVHFLQKMLQIQLVQRLQEIRSLQQQLHLQDHIQSRQKPEQQPHAVKPELQHFQMHENKLQNVQQHQTDRMHEQSRLDQTKPDQQQQNQQRFEQQQDEVMHGQQQDEVMLGQQQYQLNPGQLQSQQIHAQRPQDVVPQQQICDAQEERCTKQHTFAPGHHSPVLMVHPYARPSHRGPYVFIPEQKSVASPSSQTTTPSPGQISNAPTRKHLPKSQPPSNVLSKSNYQTHAASQHYQAPRMTKSTSPKSLGNFPPLFPLPPPSFIPNFLPQTSPKSLGNNPPWFPLPPPNFVSAPQFDCPPHPLSASEPLAEVIHQNTTSVPSLDSSQDTNKSLSHVQPATINLNHSHFSSQPQMYPPLHFLSTPGLPSNVSNTSSSGGLNPTDFGSGMTQFTTDQSSNRITGEFNQSSGRNQTVGASADISEQRKGVFSDNVNQSLFRPHLSNPGISGPMLPNGITIAPELRSLSEGTFGEQIPGPSHQVPFMAANNAQHYGLAPSHISGIGESANYSGGPSTSCLNPSASAIFNTQGPLSHMNNAPGSISRPRYNRGRSSKYNTAHNFHHMQNVLRSSIAPIPENSLSDDD